MIYRINKIIAREKIKNPTKSGIVLLFGRLLKVIQLRINNLIIQIKKDGTFSSPDEMNMCSLFPQKALDLIINELKPFSILDVGCGTGVSLNYFLNNNIEAFGVENSKLAIAVSPVKEKILKHNLNIELNLNKRYDLVWSFEVIEHIHPDFEANFLKTLMNHSNVIVLSGAKPGQGGYGHFNEQEPEYWIHKFIGFGYILDVKFTEKLILTGESYAENLLCFRKVN